MWVGETNVEEWVETRRGYRLMPALQVARGAGEAWSSLSETPITQNAVMLNDLSIYEPVIFFV